LKLPKGNTFLFNGNAANMFGILLADLQNLISGIEDKVMTTGKVTT
jgi:hypothetical protein